MRCSTPATRPLRSRHRLLTTIAYRFAGVPTYALEGCDLRRRRRRPVAARRAEAHRHGRRDRRRWRGRADPAPAASTSSLPSSGSARRGGTPTRAAPILGLTRETGAAELARAALEAVAFQTRDLLEAMAADGAARGATLRVDGGMVGERLDDAVPRRHDRHRRSSARSSPRRRRSAPPISPASPSASTSRARRSPRSGGASACSSRAMGEDERAERYAGWQDAVARTRSTR